MTDYLKVYEKFKHTKEVGDYINDVSCHLSNCMVRLKQKDHFSKRIYFSFLIRVQIKITCKKGA